MFTPIAIVGQACALPGALTPEELWSNVAEGRSAVGPAPGDRWRVEPQRIVRADATADQAFCDRGGYVRGFERVWDPEGFAIPAASLRSLDPLFHWVLHTGREALSGVQRAAALGARAGLVLGNLSYPTSRAGAFAEATWLARAGDALPPGAIDVVGAAHDPRNRFSSGLPAHLAAAALGLGGRAFAIDAACASGLYALAFACRALARGDADLMLAGGVNRADDLFLHVGFTALAALSKTGQSRPFHADADGLLPAEGAAMLALKRLDDARRDGDAILGVVRGVGISNDGRGRGVLSPSSEGQTRAMRAAYGMAGLAPRDVSMVECHATGTSVGDATELASMAEVFAGCAGVPIGSLKSNLGHLITAAGLAGVLKVLGAFRAGVRPPTLNVDRPTPALDGTPFRLLARAEPWTGARRAAVSAFGFGGNNAHAVLESADEAAALAPGEVQPARGDVALVAVALQIGDASSPADVGRALLREDHVAPRREAPLHVPYKDLATTPRELLEALPQQLAVLGAARDAAAQLAAPLPRERTAVFVGMGCDPSITRWGARWRLPEWTRCFGAALGAPVDPAWTAEVADAFVPALTSAAVIGTMPNVPANRISRALDLAGPGLTVSSEELSGLRALELACDALRTGDVDVALAGAVDFASEPVHEAACAALGMPGGAGDATAVWILKRREDAERDGDRIWAILPEDASADGARAIEAGKKTPFGRPHAALALVDASVRLLRSHGEMQLALRYEGMLGQAATLVLQAPAPPRDLPEVPEVAGEVVAVAPHMPDVRFPLLRTRAASALPAPSTAPAVMPHAPQLARAVDEPPIASPRPAPRAVAAAPAAPSAAPIPTAPAQAMPSPPPVNAPAGDTLRAALLRNATHRLERVQELHLEHLAMQQALMGDLARITETATVLLAQAASQAPSFGPADLTPPAPLSLARPLEVQTLVPSGAEPERGGSSVPTPASSEPPSPRPGTLVHPPAEKDGPGRGEGGWGVRSAGTSAPVGLPGPKLSRADLELVASGKISTIFGPLFEQQDGYARQVRMPMPPLLLADRVTGIRGEPGSMGRGTIWTETDVRPDSWYVHDSRMPPGVVIESGQADLLLISWLGADFENKGERVYRLLGCEATWLGPLPAVGDTLAFEIHVDGHARHGDVRLFFFHYDCVIRSPNGAERPMLRVRGGQAGFFTTAELAESGGILWSPEEETIDAATRLDPPAARTGKTSLDEADLDALAQGRLSACFGPAYAMADAHVWSPRIQGGKMRLFDRVTAIDPKGGPWGRGYLRATLAITPDQWFFEGHFKNDPCMPGTLMFEGCEQALSVYLMALGYSIDKDGWRFEPVQGETSGMRCRGQVIPSSRELVYEVFVREVHDGPLPTVWADLLCTVDGLKAFHAVRVGLRLVPDWPMSRPEHNPPLPPDPEPVAEVEGFRFGLHAMLASARGKPSEALGPMYARFDGHRRAPRLPGEPYHFMSRATRIDGKMGGLQQGTTVEIAYDVPPDAWYFAANGTMPLCVIMEVALQPCGWLASFAGSVLGSDIDLKFRNLDGTASLLAEVRPDAGTIVTTATLKSIARAGNMILESFEVTCTVKGQPIYTMTTSFGFFPAEAFENQEGLPPTADEKAAMALPSDVSVDLRDEPARYFGCELAIARAPLRMLDRLTGLWPAGGTHGKGRARGEKIVVPGEWFFRSHFYQDPVQPGSLGVEAIVQLAQLYVVDQGLADGIPSPHFEAVALGKALTWKYRGQVVPKNERVEVEVDVVDVVREAGAVLVVFDGALWVDGKRIYRVMKLGVRVSSGPARPTRMPKGDGEVVLDPAREPWMLEHAPTWTVPALPMTSMLDRLARAAEEAFGEPVVAIEGAQVHRWLTLPGPTRTRTEVKKLGAREAEVTLLAWREAATASLSRFEKVASARVTVGAPSAAPAPLPPLADATEQPDPYAGDELFQGPPFHRMKSWRLGREGASTVLDATPTSIPVGLLHPAMLDASLHGIPSDTSVFSPDLRPELAPLPYRVPTLRVYGPAPTSGEVRCEIRFRGAGQDHRFPEFLIQLAHGGRVWLEWVITMIGLPKGSIGMAPAPARRAFLRDKRFVPGVRLSRLEDGATTLAREDVQAIAWLPGTVEAVYGTSDVAQIAAREHLGHRLGVHPKAVSWDGALASTAHEPVGRYPLHIESAGDVVRVTDAGRPHHDLADVSTWWRRRLGPGTRAIEDLFYAMVRAFAGRFVVRDPAAFEALRGRPVLYLANHQTMVESLMFVVLAGPITDVATLGLAKIEHRDSWIGRLSRAVAAWPGASDPQLLEFFDRSNKEALPGILQRIAMRMANERQSLLVHVEGTRSLKCADPVVKISSVIIDMAVHARAPIVPVRFVGGLPREAAPARLDFPLGFGRQDYWLGAPLLPEALEAMPYGERRARVVAAINEAGPPLADEHPNPGDPELAGDVEAWVAKTGAETALAAILMSLARASELEPAWQRVLEGMRTGELVLPDTPEGRAVAGIAGELYGPRGPRVVVR